MPNPKYIEYKGFVFDGTELTHFGDNSQNRKCRFCGKSSPEITFDNDTAHSISESLGNTNFITYDECKSCNQYFSSIEQSFYRAHGPMLMMCGIKGKDNGKRKNKAKSLSGAGVKISLSDKAFLIGLDNETFQKYENDVRNKHIFNLEPILKFEKFKPVDIYKSLCKYVISVLPNEILHKFSLTLDWLFGRCSLKLPNVVSTQTQLTEHPIIGYFIRQEDSKVPYAIGFFRMAMITYVFIIPGANDETNYPNNEWLENFAYRLHKGHSKWYSEDLNSDRTIAPKMPIEIDNVHLGKSCFFCDKDQLLF